MPQASLQDLTNSQQEGVFDVLIKSVEERILAQYDEGRITGNDFANVYLGSMQTVLSESIKFLLTAEQIKEQVMKTEPGGLIDLEKIKLQEAIDLIIAQTASQYEGIQASQKDTGRKNALNTAQIDELLLNGPVDRDLKVAQTSLTGKKELDQVSATAIANAESAEKVLLIAAQTTGFKTDAKQKLLKQLYEGYAIVATTNGETGAVPSGATQLPIDALSNDILDDWGSTVGI